MAVPAKMTNLKKNKKYILGTKFQVRVKLKLKKIFSTLLNYVTLKILVS